MNNGFEAALGLGIDRLLGEPPSSWHPVVWFARVMNRFEHRWYRPMRAAGVAHAGVGVALGVGSGLVLARIVGSRLAAVVATAVACAGRMLDDEAMKVAARLAVDDLEGARRAVALLVGRDPTQLDAPGVARAVIETVAENCVDAVTAPLFWAAVGGAPGVLAHRVINTMDAMVGHRSERYRQYGWASARLDDLVNWIPARITTIVVLFGVTDPAQTARVIRQQARRHPSPNGGLIEAAFAHRLAVVLGGVNRYGDRIEDRGEVGFGPAPMASDVERAVRLRRVAGIRVAAIVAVVSVGSHLVRCSAERLRASYDRRR